MRLKVISPETYDIKYTNVPNFQISKNEFLYNIRTDSSRNRFYDAKISLPGTYFVEGEPINFTYDYSKSKYYDRIKEIVERRLTKYLI